MEPVRGGPDGAPFAAGRMKMIWAKAAMLGLILSVAAQDPAADEKKKKEEEAKAKIAEFKAELKKCKETGDFCLAIQGLGSLQHPKVMDELRVWLFNPVPEICAAAGEQVSKYSKDPKAADLLLTAAKNRKDKNPEALVKCLRYAGDVGYKPVAPMFHTYFKNKSTDVAKEAVDSVAKLGSAQSIDPLIKLMREIEGTLDQTGVGGVGGVPGVNLPGANLPGGAGGVGSPEEEMRKRQQDLLPAVKSALKSITGESYANSKDWSKWWAANRATFKEKN